MLHPPYIAFLAAPQNFTVTPKGTETLKFSWELPLEAEWSDIHYFDIECTPHFQHAIKESVLDSLTVTLEEFLPGTTYTCSVAAIADGRGDKATESAKTDEGMRAIIATYTIVHKISNFSNKSHFLFSQHLVLFHIWSLGQLRELKRSHFPLLMMQTPTLFISLVDYHWASQHTLLHMYVIRSWVSISILRRYFFFHSGWNKRYHIIW